MFNDDFYPTPRALATRMFNKINFTHVSTVLEPSAGKGDLIDALEDYRSSQYYPSKEFTISAIEIDPTLRATLTGKEIAVIDDDFLSYSGATHFDLILANFPFSEGEKHLNKALDVLYCGQLVCLINAQTLKNPCTNARKALIARLEQLNADIEYVQEAFVGAERSTNVEIALVYVNIERSVEADVFGDLTEEAPDALEDIDINREVATHNHYANMVASYHQTQTQVTEHLVNFYKNYPSVSHYLNLRVGDKEISRFERDDLSLTQIMRKQHNQFIKKLKDDYWTKVTNLPDVECYLTHSQRESLRATMDTFHCKEFTERNIRQFVLNLVENFPTYIHKAIVALFDKMTEYALRDVRWGVNEYAGNIHYFNAWKSNSGYKVNKKVILPYYGDAFDTFGRGLGYKVQRFIQDLEKVMLYFTDYDCRDSSIVKVCDDAIKSGQTRKIETRFFYISVFKKGTMHLQFRDNDLLRRFNIEACKQKGFLPMDYASGNFSDLDSEYKTVVEAFEGKANYQPLTESVPFLRSTPLPHLLAYAA